MSNVQTTKQVRNSIQAPQRGLCRMAWDLFDSATGYVGNAHTEQIAALTGMNLENLRIELRRWKRFNGIQTGVRVTVQ
jgi:hypothetical protein